MVARLRARLICSHSSPPSGLAALLGASHPQPRTTSTLDDSGERTAFPPQTARPERSDTCAPHFVLNRSLRHCDIAPRRIPACAHILEDTLSSPSTGTLGLEPYSTFGFGVSQFQQDIRSSEAWLLICLLEVYAATPPSCCFTPSTTDKGPKNSRVLG